jgi:hypothetical protein
MFANKLSRYRVLLLLICLSVISCRKHTHPHQHGFYHWKTTIPEYKQAIGELKSSGATKFYIHYFDVDWSATHKMPVPRGELNQTWERNAFLDFEYVPVVFITNRTLEQMTSEWCDTLAIKISNRINGITNWLEENAISAEFYRDSANFRGSDAHQDSARHRLKKARAGYNTELQIDCDWTAGTKDKYFRFLRKFKELNPNKTLSVTVRMYPYKYKDKMGVPPADRAMLMCYNLGQVQRPETRNSILDVDVLKQYLGGSYPIPTDVVLPVFSWYAWFRGDKFLGIIHMQEGPGDDTVRFKPEGNRLRVQEDVVIGDNYYREGDVLRLEQPTEQEITKAAKLVTDKIDDYGAVVFFDWNEQSVKTYKTAIHEVFTRF